MTNNRIDSGHAWLGDVPAHWSLTPLGRVFRERKTTVSDKDYEPLSVSMNGVVPRMENVALTANNDTRKLVRKGDYVINSRSDRKGSGGIAPRDGSVSVISTVLRPMGIEGRFAHHLLRSTAFQEEFYRWGSGIVADLWSTRYAAMSKITLPLPPVHEQRAIADLLDRASAQIAVLIEKQNELITLLQEHRLSSINSILASAQGAEGTPLRNVVTIQTGVTLGKSWDESTDLHEFPYLRVANVQTGRVDTENLTTIELPADVAKRSLLRPGDVLITEGGDRAALARGSMWHGQVDPCLHQNHIYALRPSKLLLGSYLVYVLEGSSARQYFERTRRQTTNLSATNSSIVRAFRFTLPDLQDQETLVGRLDQETAQIDALIDKATEHVALAQERRAALITAAVTGQLDITGKAA